MGWNVSLTTVSDGEKAIPLVNDWVLSGSDQKGYSAPLEHGTSSKDVQGVSER